MIEQLLCAEPKRAWIGIAIRARKQYGDIGMYMYLLFTSSLALIQSLELKTKCSISCRRSSSALGVMDRYLYMTRGRKAQASARQFMHKGIKLCWGHRFIINVKYKRVRWAQCRYIAFARMDTNCIKQEKLDKPI